MKRPDPCDTAADTELIFYSQSRQARLEAAGVGVHVGSAWGSVLDGLSTALDDRLLGGGGGSHSPIFKCPPYLASRLHCFPRLAHRHLLFLNLHKACGQEALPVEATDRAAPYAQYASRAHSLVLRAQAVRMAQLLELGRRRTGAGPFREAGMKWDNMHRRHRHLGALGIR